MAVLKLESITPNSAGSDADTSVVLVGDDFDEVVEVLVGPTVLKTLTIKSQKVLETVVPRGLKADAYDVSVINARGQKATLSKGFTVTTGQTAKSGCGCDAGGASSLGLLALAIAGVRRRAHKPSPR